MGANDSRDMDLTGISQICHKLVHEHYFKGALCARRAEVFSWEREREAGKRGEADSQRSALAGWCFIAR